MIWGSLGSDFSGSILTNNSVVFGGRWVRVKDNHEVTVSLKTEGDLGMCVDNGINVQEGWGGVTWSLCWSKKEKSPGWFVYMVLKFECPRWRAN